TEDLNRLPYYYFSLNIKPNLPSANGLPEIEMEKGRKTQISNIISGYRKTIRTGLSPFRQMFSAFDRDCYACDELIIVGYSFSDEHINDIINKARNSNDGMRIEIVDPEIDIRGYFTNQGSKWIWFLDQFECQKLSENIYNYPKYNLTIYRMFFEDYLKYKCP